MVYSALLYGWQGGLLGAALASICYFPHATAVRSGLPGLAFDRYLENGVDFRGGLVIGVLVVEIIDRESRRLNRLLTNFLNLAKPPAPQYRVISLEPVLDSVIGLASHAGASGPVTFRKKISGKKGTLECDPEQLKQVLLNLVINAAQAMPEGGEILLAARIEGHRAIMEVSDQGSGVSPEEMDKIFDPFYTTKENGTGLGLSVAHQIVLHLGGMLTARRNPGRGMTFTVIIPVQAEKVL